jgi:hypothetical protein
VHDKGPLQISTPRHSRILRAGGRRGASDCKCIYSKTVQTEIFFPSAAGYALSLGHGDPELHHANCLSCLGGVQLQLCSRRGSKEKKNLSRAYGLSHDHKLPPDLLEGPVSRDQGAMDMHGVKDSPNPPSHELGGMAFDLPE